ncbi:Metallo-dependent phosphatase-like protein [Helicostylum pulchrum]|nr:Metallo-dependent phosphatase-like protein [Helicostylum pulchrum]
MRSKWLIHSLRIFWLLFILNHEFLVFWSSAKSCALNSSGKFMLIADPQMTDDKSYKTNHLFLFLSKFYSDLYMSRNYKYLTTLIQPTDIFFTGDLMDNGREWPDAATYYREVNRFHKLFESIHKKHYMVGNHDIGFGNGIKRDKQDRFKSYFGNTSYVLETNAGYAFIVIDTVSLSSDDPQIRESALAVLNNMLPETKRILMTHVPLYRDASASCGPFRQNKNTVIKNQYGYQYQNLVSYELSSMLLNTVQPVAVFSGDDHDYCKVFHKYNSENEEAMEITIPTFSMAQGMRFPGVVTLDVSDPDTLTTELCWLPDQIGIFLRYGYFFAATLVTLILFHSFHYTSSVTPHFLLSKEEMGMTSSPHFTPSNPVKRCIHAFFQSVKDVALTCLPVYILCILLI